MAKGNGSTTNEPPRTEAPNPNEQPGENPLNFTFAYFNPDQYPASSSEYDAAKVLSCAFNVAKSVRGLSQILMADEVQRAEGADGMPLSAGLREDVTTSIHELSTMLMEKLERAEIGLFANAPKRKANHG